MSNSVEFRPLVDKPESFDFLTHLCELPLDSATSTIDIYANVDYPDNLIIHIFTSSAEYELCIEALDSNYINCTFLYYNPSDRYDFYEEKSRERAKINDLFIKIEDFKGKPLPNQLWEWLEYVSFEEQEEIDTINVLKDFLIKEINNLPKNVRDTIDFTKIKELTTYDRYTLIKPVKFDPIVSEIKIEFPEILFLENKIITDINS